MLVGIGVHPNVEIAHTAGLMVGDGIHADGDTRTANPDGVIAHLLETPYLISHMGKAGRARIEHQFTIEQYVEKTQQEYLSLIEGTPC